MQRQLGADELGEAAAIRQAALMAEDVAEGDRSRRGTRLDRVALAGDVHAHVAQLGDHAMDRVVELEIRLLIERHQRDRGNRLRHRVDAEDRVLTHRLAAFGIHLTNRREVRDFAATRHQGEGTGDLPS